MSLYESVLFDYQRVAVDRICEARKVLLADQPGLGKTVEVLASLEHAGLFDDPDVNILILSPVVAVQSAWRDSIEKWITPSHDIELVDLSTGSTAKRVARMEKSVVEDQDRARVVIANHAVLEWDKRKGARMQPLFGLMWDAVVIDESHMVLPITSDKPTKFWNGLSRLSTTSDAFRVAVSGTPDRGKLENRFGTYKFIRPDLYRQSRWAWLEQNFWITDKRVSRSRVIKSVGPLKSKRDWFIEEDLMLVRRTKAEVLKDLPAKQYNFVEVELYPEQRSDYMDQLHAMVDEQLQAEDDGRDTAASMIFALRARQIASCQWRDGVPVVGGKSAKLDWLLEWLAEREKVKVVVCSQFSQVLRWLQSELVNAGYSVGLLDGSVSVAGRASVQREFQDGDLQVCLISGRMGVGITLDASDDLIMFDLPYDPDVLEQVEDRVHRASRNHQVTIWNLLAVGSLDQVVAQKLNRRYVVTRGSMDGRRGVDIERNVLEKIRVSQPSMSQGESNVSNTEGETNG